MSANFEEIKQQFLEASLGLKGHATVDQALLLVIGGLLMGVVENLMEIKEVLANGKSKS